MDSEQIDNQVVLQFYVLVVDVVDHSSRGPSLVVDEMDLHFWGQNHVCQNDMDASSVDSEIGGAVHCHIIVVVFVDDSVKRDVVDKMMVHQSLEWVVGRNAFFEAIAVWRGASNPI